MVNIMKIKGEFVVKRKYMKHPKFFRIIFSGFLIFLYSSQIMAMEFEAGVEETFRLEGDIAVDAEGNVIKNMDQAAVKELNEAIEAGRLKSLDDVASSLKKQTDEVLAGTSQAAQDFFKKNSQVEDIVAQLKQEKLSLQHQKSLSGTVQNIEELQNVNRAQIIHKNVSKSIDKMTQTAAKNVSDLAKDLKKNMPISKLSSKYLDKLGGIDDATLERLNQGSAADIRKAMNDAVAKGDKNAVASLCTKIAKLDAMKGIVNQLKSIEGSAGRLASFEGGLQDVLDKSLSDMDAQFKQFEDNPSDLLKEEPVLDEDKNPVKDAEGKVKKQTLAEKFATDVKTNMDTVVKEDLQAIKDELETKATALGKKVGFVGRRSAAIWYRDGALTDKVAKMRTSWQSITKDDIAESFLSAGKKIKGAVGSVAEYLKEFGKMVLSGVLFMVPNIAQAAFLAQKQRQVQLQTLASPIKYGNWVFQIPDSCFNFDNPESSLPIYLRLPVSDPSLPLSKDVFTNFDQSIEVNPTTNNVVSHAIHSVGAAIASIGGDLAAWPVRYNINEGDYLSYNPGIILAYFPSSSYQAWGSVPLTSSQFTSGQIIDLTTGVIIDADGEFVSASGGQVGFTAYPLINPVDVHGAQLSLQYEGVQAFLPLIESKIDLSGNIIKYTEYESVTSGSSLKVGSGSLQSLFNCSCLSEKDTTCALHECLLTPALNTYYNGLSFNADGSVGLGNVLPTSATQTAAKDIMKKLGSDVTLISQDQKIASAALNQNLLGSVIPLYGWGSTLYSTLINETTFPSFTPSNVSGVKQISGMKDTSSVKSTVDKKDASGKKSTSDGKGASNTSGKGASNTSALENIIFADETTNYAAQGCWVYLSSSTPYATAVQAGSAQNSVYGPYVDYIIFLNKSGQQVPLMVPIQTKNSDQSYTYTTIGFNPEVTNWTSLVAYDASSGTTANFYDLQGNEYQDTTGAVAATISSAIKDLQTSFSGPSNNLYGQFMLHQQAMNYRLSQGPFKYGNNLLTLSQYSIVVPGATASDAPQASIALYTGSKCFSSDVDDLLVPVDAKSNTVTLPNSNVTQFYSLVTDIIYSFDATANTLKASDFSQSPLDQEGKSYVYDSSKTATFNIMNMFESSLEVNYKLPSGQTSYISQDLNTYLQQQRESWANQFDKDAQKQGIVVGSFTCTLPAAFDTNLAIANKCFIYELTPLPSAAYCDHDYFVLVNSSTPSLSSLSPLSAGIATEHSVAISLMTGFLFSMEDGSQIMKRKVPVRLDASVSSITSGGQTNKASTMADAIFNHITTQFPLIKIANSDFVTRYQNMVAAHEAQMHRPVGPYTYGPLSLSMFAGDLASGNYVYFNAADMHLDKFAPTDVFVTCDLKNKSFGETPLTAATPAVMSLISGITYKADGSALSRLPAATLLSTINTLKSSWGLWLQTQIDTLIKAMRDRLAAAKQEKDAVDNALKQIASQVTQHENFVTPASVAQIIKRLTPSGVNGLPAPYGLLKYDPVTQHYVYISPRDSTDGTEMLYLFFNIGVDDKTQKPVGAIFTSEGDLIHVVKGVQLQIMLDQFGVVINSDGTQKLGIPLTQPSFIMSNPDEKLVYGQDSSDFDLIANTSQYFPGGPIDMPKGYYLYYSTTMDAYYLYETKNNRWICVAQTQIYTEKDHKWSTGVGSNIYAKNGASIPLGEKVAMLTSKPADNDLAAVDDMILLYENEHNQMEGYMSDGQDYVNTQQNKNIMTWSSMSSGKSLTVVQSKDKKSYTVTAQGAQKSNNKTYTVSSSAQWYSLFAVPIDDKGAVLSKPIDLDYKNAGLIVNVNTLTHMLFHDTMYKIKEASSQTSYTMTPLDPKNTQEITVNFETDENTTAPYIQVQDGTSTYKYMYVMDTLDSAAQSYYLNLIKGIPTPATGSVPVGPLASKSVEIAGKQVTMSLPNMTTHVLFARNIPATSSGSLALTPVSATAVRNVPAQSATSAAFYANLKKVSQTADRRFFALIQPSSVQNPGDLTFSYVTNGAYVDLATGVVYDATEGISLGYSLHMDDWLSVLNNVQVSVDMSVDSKTNKMSSQLVYRDPQAVQLEQAALVADTSLVPRQPSASAMPSVTIPVTTAPSSKS